MYLCQFKKSLSNSSSMYLSHIGQSSVKPLAMPENIKSIFETSQGSIYKVMQSGQSSRLKAGSKEPEPNNEAIFYIEENEFRRITENIVDEFGLFMNFDVLVGKRIKIVPLNIGVRPLELNPVDQIEKIVYEIVDGYLMLFGTRVGTAYKEGMLFGSLHFGHPVSKIVQI